MKKPNPSKDGDGKPRVLASSGKSWKITRRTQDRRAADTVSTEQVAGGTMNTLRLSTLSLTLVMAVITLGYVNTSIADPPGMGEHSHGGDGPEDVAEYSVTITGDVVGGSADNWPWLGNFGGKKAIGLNHASGPNY